jgi:hypothetical protein
MKHSLTLKPQVGTIQDAENIHFEIANLSKGVYRVQIENATDSISLKVKDYDNEPFVIDDVSSVFEGYFNLSIPEHSSNSVFSVFAVVEKQVVEDVYQVDSIIPAVFSVSEQATKFDGALALSPQFASRDDICSIQIMAKPDTKTVFSVNDRRFKIHTNAEGKGSLHFKTSDVLLQNIVSAPLKYPLYFYSEEDDFVDKKFTGFHLNVLPDSIMAHQDPRCDPTSPEYLTPGSWVMPDDCLIQPPGEIPDGVVPSLPPLCIPTSDKEGNLLGGSVDVCRIFSNSATLLNNGMVLHAYSMVDTSITDASLDGYNMNKIYLASSESTIDVQVITSRDVSLAPKTALEDFEIHVSEDVWNHFDYLDNTSLNDVSVMFYDEGIGYHCANVTGRTIDPYTGDYYLVADGSASTIVIDSWLFCVHAVFYHRDQAPATYPSSLTLSEPFVKDEAGTILQTVKVAVASNPYYIGDNEETHVYIVAEAIISNQSQLFFYALSVGKESGYSSEEYGWVQLTDSGNNKNPRIFVDKTNTLHVIWESDRAGLSQIFYGVLGSTDKSVGAAAFSSLVDKFSEINERSDRAFDYVAGPIVTQASSDEYNPIPEYETQSLVSNVYRKQMRSGGSVAEVLSSNHLNDLRVTANPVTQQAIAFAPLQIVIDADNPSAWGPNPYLQYNAEVSFDFGIDIVQPSSLLESWDGNVVPDKDMDELFDQWKSTFDSSVGSSVTNMPVYIKNGNTFVLGRQDGVFDNVIPLVGSYNADFDNPSANMFQIRILKSDNNLKDFSFGLMLEKSYFKAINTETSVDYAAGEDPSVYISEETHTLYTGRAKLVAFIKTEDKTDTAANYIIVREFPDKFDITQDSSYTILMNYTKISSDEVVNMLDVNDGSYPNRYIGMVTLLINSISKFSQSFISNLSYSYNYFDIGFGIPDGGYYAADRMYPSKMTVFDDVPVVLNFSNIEIQSPTYTYNSGVSSLPDTTVNCTSLRALEPETVTQPELLHTLPYDNSVTLLNLGYRSSEQIEYVSTVDGPVGTDLTITYNVTDIDIMTVEFSTVGVGDQMIIRSAGGTTLYDTGSVATQSLAQGRLRFSVDVSNYNSVDVEVTAGAIHSDWDYVIYHKTSYDQNKFLQIPLSLDGVNQSANISYGICNDTHVCWQSNRSRYWDVYTCNSVDKLRPFRFETRITNTESNSIVPSISVCRNGSRLISWHDNRNGDYDIYSARSVENYSCDEFKCREKMLSGLEDNIIECNLAFEYVSPAYGYYKFDIELYNDYALTDIYKTLSVEDDNTKWYVFGTPFADLAVYDSNGDLLGILLDYLESVIISYVPNQGDSDIFDKILYVRLVKSE